MADNQQSGAPQNRGKKRSKSYYIRAKEGKRIRKDTMLTVGMRGILLTCNHGVKPCVKEAYNLLAEYADQMYGPEKDEHGEEEEKEEAVASEDKDDDCEDMEASLQKEIAGMKQKSKGRKQCFQAVESGAKNVAFIKAKIDDPCELVHRILTDIQETKTSKSRHIMRMLPVTASFRSYIEDIEKQAPSVLKPHFEREDGQELSFCVMFKVRNCGHLKRNDVITTLHSIVTGMGKHRVDLTNADRVILVEGVRNVVCVSVLKDFFKLRKYNLQGITEQFADNTATTGRWGKKAKKNKPASNENVGKGDGGQQDGGKEGNSLEGQAGNDMDGTDGDKVCANDSKSKEDSEGQAVSDVKTGEDVPDVKTCDAEQRTSDSDKVDGGECDGKKDTVDEAPASEDAKAPSEKSEGRTDEDTGQAKSDQEQAQ